MTDRSLPDRDAELLDAALEQFALLGVRRTSADDIARRAGVNRATLYRRLGTMDQIVRAAVLHETARVLGDIEAELGEVPAPGSDDPFDPSDYIAGFFAATLSALRQNRVLQRLLEVDHADTLSGLTDRADGVVSLSTAFIEERIRAIHRWLGQEHEDADVAAVASTWVRLNQSLILTPTGPPGVHTHDQMEAFARRIVVPLALGGASR